jgi:hypothetical protein
MRRFVDATGQQMKLRALPDASTTKGRFCYLAGRLFKRQGLFLTMLPLADPGGLRSGSLPIA